MKRECKVCGSKENINMAHMISRQLSQILVKLQIRKNFYKLDNLTQNENMFVMRKKARDYEGKVFMCLNCHMHSDHVQRQLVSYLKSFRPVEL